MRTFCLAVLVAVSANAAVFAETVSDHAVQVSATVSKSPASITLSWPAPTYSVSQYRIYRKSENDGSFGGTVATIAGNSTSWTDTNVSVGSAYEYKIDTNGGYGVGYIFAGIEAPLVEDRGKVVLLVDNSMAQPLSGELSRLQQDLTGDGWTVIRHDVGRTASLPQIKQTVQSDYNADPNNVKALFIFGHVPVPYSGDLNPDGHGEHKGAWPSDTYFANIDGGWSDNSVNDTRATARTDDIKANWNTPGDGKFDPSGMPGDAKLQVGRVDLWNMPTFNTDETSLLRNYLNKDHNFRMGGMNAQRRGILCDNFGTFNGEAFAGSGWRAFAPLMGANSVDVVPDENGFVSKLKSNTYLWGYGCGPGYWFSVGNVVTTDDFHYSDPHVVFCMLFGSFFGDWDCQNNVMRSVLATNSCGLATMWAGRPHWNVHHMALGRNIGYSAKLTQNNTGLYLTGSSPHSVHVTLLGDPTLRMHPVFAPGNLGAQPVSSNSVTLSWGASADTIVGYHVYRSGSSSGPFSRITNAPITTTNYTDTTVSPGTYTYMVRAIKLETSGGGSYYNPSQGVFANVTVTSGGSTNNAPTITSAASATPNPSTAGQSVNLSVSASDPDNDTLTYAWDFGDGNSGSGASTSHTYTTAGTYTATASVSDGHGHTVTSSKTVTVNGGNSTNNPPTITAAASATPNPLTAGQSSNFSVSASDADNDALTYSWNFGDGNTGSNASVSHTYANAGTYNATVSVNDGHGHTVTSSVSVTVNSNNNNNTGVTFQHSGIRSLEFT